MIEIFEEMRKQIPHHPTLKKELKKLMDDGLSKEDALNIMILAWLTVR